MKRDEIEVDPDVCNGRPVVRGTRIAVESVLGMLAAGENWVPSPKLTKW